MSEANGQSPNGHGPESNGQAGQAGQAGEAAGAGGAAEAVGAGERVTPKRDLRPNSGFGPGGRGPMGFMGGMSTQKALNFSGSSKRLLRMLAPQRALMIIALAMGTLSVAFSVIGPKVLGNVTNLIFDGYLSSKIPPNVSKA